MAKVYVAFMGRSIWGTFNSAWASAIHYNFLPERVYLVVNACDRPKAELCRGMLGVLYDEFQNRPDVQIISVNDMDFVELAKTIGEIVNKEKQQGNDVAFDVTGGVKLLVLGGVLSQLKEHPWSHIFYLYVASTKNADRPYLQIPLSAQHHHDLWQEVRPDAAHHH